MKYKRLIHLSTLILMFIWSGISSGSTAIESLLPKDIPEGWALIDGPHLYTRKTLFEHVNGQAELFFKYGFQKSAFGVYQNLKNRENQIELDVYDMGNVLQAFGIFSRFRYEDRPGRVGLDSYLDDRSLLFYKGKYFVMLYATESNPSVLKQWGMKIASRIVDPSLPPKEIGYFPKKKLKAGSIQYFPEGLLGHQFLKGGFQGTYIEKHGEKVEVEAKVEVKVEDEDKDKAKTGNKEFHLFLAIFKNSQDAVGALRIYKDYLTQKGKVLLDPPIGFGPNSFRGEDPYQGQIIVTQKGIYLLGAIGFEKAKNGEQRLAELMKTVK